MHLGQVDILSQHFPSVDRYPFNLPQLRKTRKISFSASVTFFVGENGTGKSALLEAIAHRCSIHIWERRMDVRVNPNPWWPISVRDIRLRGFTAWMNRKLPCRRQASLNCCNCSPKMASASRKQQLYSDPAAAIFLFQGLPSISRYRLADMLVQCPVS